MFGKYINLTETPVNGILCQNDYTARGLIKALTERKIKVPDDIAVIGYDDSHVDARDKIPLTSVHIPNYEIGRQAMNILLHHLEGKNEVIQRLLKPNLIVRQSG